MSIKGKIKYRKEQVMLKWYRFRTWYDKFMGCDGIWDVLNNQDTVDFVLEKYEELKQNQKQITELKGKTDNNIAYKLAEYAIHKKSQDNISVTIIFFTDNL